MGVFTLGTSQAQVTVIDQPLIDGLLPTGWTAVDVTFSTAAGGYANVAGITGTLTSNVVDLTAYASVQLTFDVAKFGSGTDGPITVEISDDGGVNFTAQTFDSPIPTTSTYLTSGPTDITASTANVVIRFTTVNSASGKRLRNVTLIGFAGVPGCTDPTACNYDASATADDGTCEFTSCAGCTDINACNYDATAIIDDGSCTFVGGACDDGDATTIGDVYLGDCSCAGTPVVTPDLIITEIHYNGNDGIGFPDANYEYVEIYNNEATAVDLTGYSFIGITYTFPAGSSIAPGEYIIVALDPPFFTGNGYQVFGPFTGALGNSGETVTLLESNGVAVDEVPYDDIAPWPTSPDGAGPSLELIDIALDNSIGSNWQASCDDNGTPGAMNSMYPCNPSVPATINDIQTGVVLTNTTVEVNGIVTGVYASVFAMQDGTGAFSGIWVEGTGVAEGDAVTVIGDVTESATLTIITNTIVTVNTSGNALPAPEVLGTLAINDEQWEGVLVESTGFVVNGDAGFGEWSFDDATGPIFVDDLNGAPITPLNLGDQYTVTGPLYYSFGAFKIAPRDNASDIQKWGCTDIAFPNYDPVAVIDDGSCGVVPGCTNPAADNYDPAATVDDGTCVVSGCTDPLALNYNMDANNDDGTCYYTLPNLVINEIHYNPCTTQGDDLVYEFVEIYNADAAAVDLEGISFIGLDFSFPAGATIAPGEYIVVAIVAATYEGNGYQVFEWTAGGVNNSGEEVALVDAFGNVIDTVFYDDIAPWPTSPDGGCPSLELIDPLLDNADPANWQASYVDNGTPGAANSTAPLSTNYTIFEIQSDVDANGGSNKVSEYVTITGVVTGVYTAANLYSIQDGTGAYSGIWVEGAGVALGDEVDVTGTVTESFDLTIITGSSAVILSSGNTLPAAEALVTNGMNAEEWEGVLVTVTGPVSNGDIGFGEWAVNDISGDAIVDDLGIALTPVDAGVTYTVTGPNYYSFGAFKIEPRNLNDAQRWGCTDNTFPNFDPLAVIDDGSCGNIPGCTNPTADNYDATATVDDGSCIISGCTDVTALNYNVNANNEDGSCYFTLPNLVINEIHYNPCPFEGNDFAAEFVEIYNAEAVSVDLGGFTFTSPFDFTFPAGSSIGAGEYIIIAIAAATYSGNGYQVFEIAFGNLSNTSATVQLEDGFGNIIDTVTYSDSAPWPFEADGGCVSLELIDPALDNSLAVSWQNSFVLFGTPGAQNSSLIEGCMDPTACNYDATAIADDGSCDYASCQGCTYANADNYNALATVDDGSCLFTFSCPEDLNNDGVINAVDLLQFLGVFGTTCE